MMKMNPSTHGIAPNAISADNIHAIGNPTPQLRIRGPEAVAARCSSRSVLSQKTNHAPAISPPQMMKTTKKETRPMPDEYEKQFAEKAAKAVMCLIDEAFERHEFPALSDLEACLEDELSAFGRRVGK